MRRISQPFVWFPVALLLVSAATAVLLAQDAATHATSRNEAYWALHYWQCAFDAVSACAGCGLATFSIAKDYTPFGRWVLTAGGFFGACLFVAAAGQALRRSGLLPRLGGAQLIGGLVVAQLAAAALLGGVLYVSQLSGGAGTGGAAGVAVSETAWDGVAAYSSTGFIDPALLQRWPGLVAVAVISVLAAIGPLGAMLVAAGSRSAALRLVPIVLGAWLLATVLIVAFERPKPAPMGRGAPAASADQAVNALDLSVPLREQPWPARVGRAFVQTVCAIGSGVATEPLTERGVSDGTKLTLALLVLAGGAPGSATGGAQALLLLLALGGVAQLLRGRGALAAGELRHAQVATAGLLALLALTAICTGGVLLLDAWTASPFQSPATLADALLDSASAVGGANLSSGVTATLTARNLSSGIRNPTDQYQYGMVWLMLAMLAGRVLPLLVLARLAEPPTVARPAASS